MWPTRYQAHKCWKSSRMCSLHLRPSLIFNYKIRVSFSTLALLGVVETAEEDVVVAVVVDVVIMPIMVIYNKDMTSSQKIRECKWGPNNL